MNSFKSFNLKIRNKILACFVSITIFISIFFVIEGYYSTKKTAQILELKHAHDFLLFVEKIVDIDADIDVGNDQYLSLSNGREFGNIKLKKLLKIEEVSINPHTDLDFESEKYFYDVKGNTYIGLHHVSEKYGIHYIKKINLFDRSLSEHVKRSIITSSIVLWICIWVSVYVAVILANFINSVNKDRMLLAYTEKRTGLKNLTFLEQKTSLDGKDVIVIDMVDLSRFEEAFGANSRDEVLAKFSDKLKKLESKKYVVGHYEYSRFYLICDNILSINAYKLAQQILDALNTVIYVSGIEFKSNLVLGISNGDNEAQLNKAVSAARYARHTPNNIAVFSEDIEFEAKKRLSYSSELTRAIENNEFITVYQPKIDLLTGTMMGAECLVRWQHPRDGVLSPDKFIDLVPSSHISNKFTLSLIYLVIKQVEEWKEAGTFIKVSVNVFPLDVASSNFVGKLKELALNKPWITDFLELELLESETSLRIKEISSGLNELKKIGIICSIDDFGTGMSSLAYMKTIPISIVKIDRTFIQDILYSAESEAIVKGVVSMAKDMHWTVIAEGVESLDISNKLVSIGVELAQGFYYSKPVSSFELLKMYDKKLKSKYLRELDKYQKEYMNKLLA